MDPNVEYAFPRSGFELDCRRPSQSDTIPQEGMSLRDYFAASALKGLAANGGCYLGIDRDAYEIADQMMLARQEKK